MLNCLIFNKAKWYRASQQPLIGKHAEVKKTAKNVYVWESSGHGFYAYHDTDKSTSGTIRGETTSVKFYGASTPSDVHMISLDPDSEYWYKVEDVTISEG